MPSGFGRNMYEVSQTQIVGYLEVRFHNNSPLLLMLENPAEGGM